MLNLALPDNFAAKSLHPEVTPNLFDGVVWGEEKDVDSYLSSPEISGKLIRDYPKGNMILIADFSPNETQIDKDRFSIEEIPGQIEEVQHSFEARGYRDVKVRKFHWGPYPVLSVQMNDRKGVPICMAWIGLNYGKMVLAISAVFSKDPATYKKGLQIWQQLMDNTAVMVRDDILKAMGFDIKPGISSYTRAKAKINAWSEKAKDGKIHVMIEKLSPNTRVEVKGSCNDAVLEPGGVKLDVGLMIDIIVQDFKVLSGVCIPLLPKESGPQELQGKNIYEDERVIVLEKS